MRVLIIEDDVSLVVGLKKALAPSCIAIDHADDGLDGAELAMSEDYTLIVIDLSLPGMAGDEVVRTLRRSGVDAPILILTATTAVAEKVRCLDLGADDYLTKPFELSEFEARIRALARRRQGRADPILTCGQLVYDTSTATATLNGATLQLRRRENAVLATMMAHAGKLVRKERLISQVFSFDEAVAPNAIELYIGRVRHKLAPDGPRIRTIRGLGYLMENP